MCSGRRLMPLNIVAMALLLAFPANLVLAKGPGESEAARTERAKGTVALNLGQYDEAIEHFSRAYALTQDPILLFNLGQAFRLAGKPDRAVASYSSFLRAAGPGTKYKTQFERAATEIETITPNLVCPPRDHEVADKRPDDSEQLEGLMNARVPKEKRAPAPPIEPDPVEEPIEPPPVAVKSPSPVPAPSPPPAPAPGVVLTMRAAPTSEPESKRLYKKTWFWGSVVGVLAVGAAATWWFTRSQNQVPSSTYGSTRVLP